MFFDKRTIFELDFRHVAYRYLFRLLVICTVLILPLLIQSAIALLCLPISIAILLRLEYSARRVSRAMDRMTIMIQEVYQKTKNIGPKLFPNPDLLRTSVGFSIVICLMYITTNYLFPIQRILVQTAYSSGSHDSSRVALSFLALVSLCGIMFAAGQRVFTATDKNRKMQILNLIGLLIASTLLFFLEAVLYFIFASQKGNSPKVAWLGAISIFLVSGCYSLFWYFSSLLILDSFGRAVIYILLSLLAITTKVFLVIKSVFQRLPSKEALAH
jgi:hypothetical protein